MEETLLGLKLKSSGFNGHFLERVRKGNGILIKLKRFSKLTPQLKTILIKTLLVPVLEYPPIPTCSASKTQLLKLQKVQNKALRFINENDAERVYTTKELHDKYNFLPINVSLHNKAVKIWQNLEHTEEDTYHRLQRSIEGNHTWLPRTGHIINAPLPDPMYTSHN